MLGLAKPVESDKTGRISIVFRLIRTRCVLTSRTTSRRECWCHGISCRVIGSVRIPKVIWRLSSKMTIFRAPASHERCARWSEAWRHPTRCEMVDWRSKQSRSLPVRRGCRDKKEVLADFEMTKASSQSRIHLPNAAGC